MNSNVLNVALTRDGLVVEPRRSSVNEYVSYLVVYDLITLESAYFRY